MKTEASKNATRLNRHATAVLAILLTLTVLLQAPNSLAIVDNPATLETLTLTAYFDGFVMITHEFRINQTYPSVDINLLSENQENLLFIDEQNTPLDYTIAGNIANVYSLGASSIKASYLTQDLTTKTGKYWSLKAQVLTNTTIILPEAAVIISLNDVPQKIESTNGLVSLVMPAGTIDITYTAEHGSFEQTEANNNDAPETPWLLIAAVSSLAIPTAAFAFLFLRHRKATKLKPKKIEEQPTAVDIDKLFAKEKDLRQEEVQVIRFLAEKNGSAFEAELYEKLQLPRTSTWRLLKRLEKMEIVDIKKSRRQNIVSIRKKYMKK